MSLVPLFHYTSSPLSCVEIAFKREQGIHNGQVVFGLEWDTFALLRLAQGPPEVPRQAMRVHSVGVHWLAGPPVKDRPLWLAQSRAEEPQHHI